MKNRIKNCRKRKVRNKNNNKKKWISKIYNEEKLKNKSKKSKIKKCSIFFSKSNFKCFVSPFFFPLNRDKGTYIFSNPYYHLISLPFIASFIHHEGEEEQWISRLKMCAISS